MQEHEASVCTGQPGGETISTSGQKSNQVHFVVFLFKHNAFSLQFDPLDTHISDASQKQLKQMEHHEDEEHKFCDVDGVFSVLNSNI